MIYRTQEDYIYGMRQWLLRFVEVEDNSYGGARIRHDVRMFFPEHMEETEILSYVTEKGIMPRRTDHYNLEEITV